LDLINRVIYAPEIKSVSYDLQKPKFSLEHLSKDNKFCLPKCDLKQKAKLIDKLHRLSSLTWHQIKASPRHKMGTETIKRNSIKSTLPEILKKDPSINIIAIRCFEKLPMVGYKDRDTFFICWLDRLGKLYNHGK